MSERILPTHRSLLKETLYVSILFFSIFLLLSLLGMPGRAETYLNHFFFEYFSWASLIFPVALLWLFRPYRTSRKQTPLREPQIAPAGAVDTQGQPESPDLLFGASLAFAEQVGAVGVKSLRKRFNMGHGRAKKIIDELDRRGLLSDQTDEVGRRLLSPLSSSR